jgi:hypothetical protein
MMAEREDVAVRRAQCAATLRALREALAELESLPAALVGRVGGSSRQFAASRRDAAVEGGAGWMAEHELARRGGTRPAGQAHARAAGMGIPGGGRGTRQDAGPLAAGLR